MTGVTYSVEQVYGMAEALREIAGMDESNPASSIAARAMRLVDGPPKEETRQPLTERQAEIIRFLFGFRAQHGYAPTVREIGEAMGIRSPNGVMCHIRSLASKGYIRKSFNKSRSFVVIN